MLYSVIKVEKRKNNIFFLIVVVFSLLSSSFFTPETQPPSTYNLLLELYKPNFTSHSTYYTRLEINEIIQNKGIKRFIAFFDDYTNNTQITSAILSEALKQNIPVMLAFALAWGESKFNPTAKSELNTNGSRDWGLFQLNDKIYKWDRTDFFDINKNATIGIKHLAECISKTENAYLGLASYNAGIYRVKNGSIPQSTDNHIIEILEYEDKLNKAFNNFLKGKL